LKNKNNICVISAGSVVTRDVPDHSLVVENPAKIIGWIDKLGMN